MPRILKNYGNCEKCNRPIIGHKTKSYHRDKLYHKKCSEIRHGSSSSNNSECSICMEPMTDNTISTSCHHSFHKSCLETWQKSGQPNAHTCPFCRAQLQEPSGRISQEELELAVSIFMTLPSTQQSILSDVGVQWNGLDWSLVVIPL